MKKLFSVLTFALIGALSPLCQAQADLQPLENQIKKITTQSFAVKKAFDDYGLDVTRDPYQTLWEFEWTVSDLSEVLKNTVELFRKASDKKENLSHSYVMASRSTSILALRCATSQLNFDDAKRSRKLPADVLDQLDIQSANIRDACDFMKAFKISP